MPGGRDEVRRFERFPLVIGRSAACDLVLRDESRFVSSNHAVISVAGGALAIRDTSANGVFLNRAREPLGRGNEMPLSDRDVIGIGDYEMTVSIDAGEETATTDPFAALLDDGHAPPEPPPPAPGGGAGAAASVRGHADDPFDPWQGAEPDWPAPAADAPGAMADGLSPAAAPGHGAHADPFAADDPFAPARSPAASGGAPAAEDDWADWPADPSPPARTPPAPPAPDPYAPHPANGLPDRSPGRAFAPPPAGSAPAHERRRERVPAAVSGGRPDGSPDLAARAGATPEASGEALLLQCLDGLMALLRSRSELKQAMRSDVTSLAGTGNNPLKFSRDGRDALARLRAPSRDGEYLAAEDAVAQAIDDLAAHQVAMLEGMKGAVGALLERFDPDNLTERLTKDHPIAANIPVTREARLWQLFEEHYQDIERAARGDFTAVFGREFRKAYEARIRQLGREPDLW